jgi:hypothetical protein
MAGQRWTAVREFAMVMTATCTKESQSNAAPSPESSLTNMFQGRFHGSNHFACLTSASDKTDFHDDFIDAGLRASLVIQDCKANPRHPIRSRKHVISVQPS